MILIEFRTINGGYVSMDIDKISSISSVRKGSNVGAYRDVKSRISILGDKQEWLVIDSYEEIMDKIKENGGNVVEVEKCEDDEKDRKNDVDAIACQPKESESCGDYIARRKKERG